MNLTQVDDKLLIFLKNAGYNNPTPLQSRVFPAFFQKKDIIAGVEGAKGKRASFIVPILISLDSHQRHARVIIIASVPETVKKAGREFSRCISRNSSNLIVAELISDSMIKQELKALSNCPDVIIGTPQRIIDHIRRENINLSHIKTAIVDNPGSLDENGFDQDLHYIFSKVPGKHQRLFYTDNINNVALIEPLVKNPIIITMAEENSQENPKMKRTKDSVDAAEIEKKIESLIKSIKEDEDPDLLNTYRKLFKKHTPMTMRGYLSAYLLMHADGGVSRPSKKRISDPEKTTLFISVGKNRRVFPKDLARLFQSKMELDEEAIGSIKVLDSYSFIEISHKYAEKAIELLNGEEYKGRKLTVNHARKRSN
ncbi:MAG: DEAD/DEAH box helicase [Spirochaetales bacterium]|nr:DEAD/DEAH box helicase [Spirochaetales bacterium]